MGKHIIHAVAFGVLAASCFGSTAEAASKLNTADFVAACVADENVTQLPGFEDGKVKPQAYCECVAGKIGDSKMSQKDVDMLVKLHKDAITDDDAAAFSTLEDLMTANEGLEDACKKSLGLPVDTDDEEAPADQEDMPDDQPE